MTNNFKSFVGDFRKSNVHDAIGLYEVIGCIQRNFKPHDTEQLKELTFDLVKEMLAEGFLAVYLFHSGAHNVPWENQDVECIINRIKIEWQTLSRIPNIGDIVYFDLSGSSKSHSG